MTSAWPTRVGSPVEGPPRCTLITTQGTSIIAASPRFSIMRENPGPEVAVMARAPATEAPTMAAMLASSSSIWTKRPPTSGSRRASHSATPVGGGSGERPLGASVVAQEEVLPGEDGRLALHAITSARGTSTVKIAYSGQTRVQNSQWTQASSLPGATTG